MSIVLTVVVVLVAEEAAGAAVVGAAVDAETVTVGAVLLRFKYDAGGAGKSFSSSENCDDAAASQELYFCTLESRGEADVAEVVLAVSAMADTGVASESVEAADGDGAATPRFRFGITVEPGG